ncbi:hypothetical protein DFH07DRAFT_962762 [Mycena maculata]|uniref:Uncharacterized protein n=1 Tax=Mycena maculata TaxID=230809 RepID=A0AAD7IQJ9_9AGAR|nr:hypothetical protein DFH07DRAFT_962762 [Mycena maculata]
MSSHQLIPSLATSDELCTCISVLADVVASTPLVPLKTALTIGNKAGLIISLTNKINICDSPPRPPPLVFPSPRPSVLASPDELCTCIRVLADVVATTTLAPLKTALTINSSADLITSLTGKANLCGFTCKSGYTVSGGKCVANTAVSTSISTVVVSSTIYACISGTLAVKGTKGGSLSTSSPTLWPPPPLKTALTIGTQADVVLSLTDKINSYTGSVKQTCISPNNVTPACSKRKSGYTRSGSNCAADKSLLGSLGISI